MKIDNKISFKQNSINVEFVFIKSNRLKYNYSGKCYPTQTQCLIFFNGLLESFSTISLHYKDVDDVNESYKLSALKSLDNFGYGNLKYELIDFINNYFKN